MKKILLVISSTLILFSFQLTDAKERFGILLDLGHTVAMNDHLKQATAGGKTSFGLGFEYILGTLGRKSHSAFLLGFQVGNLSFKGNSVTFAADPGGMKTLPLTSDWDWTAGIAYLKVLIDRSIVTPFVKMGIGTYHLNLVDFTDGGSRKISENYAGVNVGGGLEFSLRHFALFAEIEDNFLFDSGLKPPEALQVGSSVILNPKIGVVFRF